MSKEIQLTQSKVATVDDADYEWLSQWKWCAGKEPAGYYAMRKGRHKKTIKMHRQIMGFPKGYEVDHRNGNSLDNQKENLRVCSHNVNCQNRKANTKGTSQFKGVHWFSRIKRWSTRIRHNGISYFLGNFNSEIDAARAYDAKAKELGRTRRSYNFD